MGTALLLTPSALLSYGCPPTGLQPPKEHISSSAGNSVCWTGEQCGCICHHHKDTSGVPGKRHVGKGWPSELPPRAGQAWTCDNDQSWKSSHLCWPPDPWCCQSLRQCLHNKVTLSPSLPQQEFLPLITEDAHMEGDWGASPPPPHPALCPSQCFPSPALHPAPQFLFSYLSL